MNPTKAQRIWHSLSTKWINASPYGSHRGRLFARSPRRKRRIRKGVLVNLIPVEVVNAITGEVSKGFMRDLSIRRLRKWLEFHNHRAQVEQVSLLNSVTFSHMTDKEYVDFPILIKLGKYQVPYLIDRPREVSVLKGKKTITFDLKTADNLKYLEVVADRKEKTMALFNKIKKAKKRKSK